MSIKKKLVCIISVVVALVLVVLVAFKISDIAEAKKLNDGFFAVPDRIAVRFEKEEKTFSMDTDKAVEIFNKINAFTKNEIWTVSTLVSSEEKDERIAKIKNLVKFEYDNPTHKKSIEDYYGRKSYNYKELYFDFSVLDHEPDVNGSTMVTIYAVNKKGHCEVFGINDKFVDYVNIVDIAGF